ncbi:bromo adjacent homology domain-containing 1 protein [Periophthalmus magnuspinnatus]|uniref:bromo adjacent homology domain-containing 1 protein n=1 Tax=Periophthalmus magnuspinnatus TaxID=409849 RepID=UPI00145BCC0D|nr:bromo adjacent homology domain-containing 1 protein [Periophthalmus magnuspinnatus]
MTQARQKASLQQRRTAEWVDQSPLWTHGGAADEPWPERSLRFGRTKKIGEVMKRTKKKRKMAVEEKKEKSLDQNKKLDRRREKKRDRKLYPLRGRAAGSEGEGLSCHVILTRLEESQADSERKTRKDGHHKHLTLKRRGRKSKKDAKTLPKQKTKSNSASIADYMHVLQPRKRRLASLNAEAVNTLLLERPWDTQPAAKQARKQDEAVTVGGAAEGDATTKTTTPGPAGKVTLAPKMCQKFKAKKAKAKVKVKSNPFELSQESLDAPAPRRLAGLNAAALLKLTSTSATAKQRVKSTPTTTTTTTTTTATSSDCKTQAPTTMTQHARVKYKGRPPKHKGKRALASQHGCAACKKKSDFEPKVEWDSNGCTHRLTKPGYQSRSMMSYPLKQVKEEQMEAELSPYYCCPPKGSVEYCHRLAFFLGQQPYSESSNQQLKSALTPVKRECLMPSPSLTHSHPHTALTLSPHPCLCTADHCFSSYYVHITHPPHAGTASPTMTSRPLNFAPSGLCSGQMSGSKAGSGLAHPAYCNSVGAPCFGEACRMGGCAFRAMPPVTSRGCTFSAGCTGCTHNIKTESYSSPQADPSLMVSSSLPISTCPLSTPPTSTQNTKPQLLPPQPPARLKLAKECPQPAKTPTKPPAKSSAKTSNGSLSMGRTRLSQKQPPPPAPALSSTKQKRVTRRRATNGWRPVGVPTEKEVFIAGEDETALRQCYEGVERDGEVIRVRDTVLLRSGPRKKSLPYVAKISALWEDPKSGELMMSLFWYYRPEHTQGGRDPSAHCENEIFASRHQDENSVACIEDRCYVLPLAQYCRFCALVKRRAEGAPPGCRGRLVPSRPDFAPPTHRCVPSDIDPDLVYLCRHVYDFRYGRILKNLQ